MFGEDPKTVVSGKEHYILPWMRSWRNLYIYVIGPGVRFAGSPKLMCLTERNYALLGSPRTLRTGMGRWLLPRCAAMESSKCQEAFGKLQISEVSTGCCQYCEITQNAQHKDTIPKQDLA